MLSRVAMPTTIATQLASRVVYRAAGFEQVSICNRTHYALL